MFIEHFHVHHVNRWMYILISRMTVNSKFVLCWEIDNAASRFATGKVESEVFNEGGFKWTVAIARHPDSRFDKIDFTLRFESEYNALWKCEAEVEIAFHRPKLCGRPRRNFCFDANNCNWMYTSTSWSWDRITQHADDNDKATIEFHIRIVSSERDEPIVGAAKFTSRNGKSNVILKFDNKKLHVSKEILADHSPVFETLFFGDFAEKGKEEVEIKEVVYEEFVDLLRLIYLETVEITDHNVVHILKLADQFQMERVLTLSKKQLMQSKGFDVMTKLQLADQYRLTSVKEHCLNSFTSATDLTVKLKSSPEYANFSADMQAAILQQIVKLT